MSAFTLKSGRKAHAVRNRQNEYVGQEGKNVIILEMYCGRKVREFDAKSADESTCKSCAKGVRKAGA